MFSCCGDGKEDSTHDTNASKAKTAQPKGPTYGGGGSNRGEPRSSGAVRSGAPQKALPIEAPKLSLVDLKQMTGNFGSRVLIGDGSYCQVYYGKLSDGQEAIIKMLDTSSSSPEPDTDFTNQEYRIHSSFRYASFVGPHNHGHYWRQTPYMG